jgi:cysteine-rich secretory family protein
MKRFITAVVTSSALLALTQLCAVNPAAAEDRPTGEVRGLKILEGGSAKDAPVTPMHSGVGVRVLRRIGLVNILSLTNEFRSQNGVPQLRGSSVLNTVAQRYAALMAEKDEMGHSVDGKSAGQRITAAGYTWTACAENVAWNMGQANPYRAAVEQWKNSPPHRANMLNPQYTEMGAGMAISKSGKYYFCQVFATPR